VIRQCQLVCRSSIEAQTGSSVILEISNTLPFMLKEAWVMRGEWKKPSKDERGRPMVAQIAS
jgi:hypothetical protein